MMTAEERTLSFLEWLLVDSVDVTLDALLALSAGGLVWVATHGLRSLL
jgi:hypothetical protein